MPGVKGAGGPVPKRSDQRRRRNKANEPTKAPAGAKVEPPEAPEHWHETARAWYESLALSGQSVFYEPADWATAFVIAESMSRDLKPQVVGIKEESGDPVFAIVPLKGASLSAYLKAMSLLLVTEGDRRRAGLELQRPVQQPEGADTSNVASLDDLRSRLTG